MLEDLEYDTKHNQYCNNLLFNTNTVKNKYYTISWLIIYALFIIGKALSNMFCMSLSLSDFTWLTNNRFEGEKTPLFWIYIVLDSSVPVQCSAGFSLCSFVTSQISVCRLSCDITSYILCFLGICLIYCIYKAYIPENCCSRCVSDTKHTQLFLFQASHCISSSLPSLFPHTICVMHIY